MNPAWRDRLLMIGMGLGVLALGFSVVVALRGTRGEVPPKRPAAYKYQEEPVAPALPESHPSAGDEIEMQSSQAACPDGVEAWWSADWWSAGMAETQVMDSVNSRGFALRNDISLINDMGGRRAFGFDGQDDFVELEDHTKLRHLPRFTLAAWIKAVSEPRFRGIVGKIHSQEPRPGYLLNINAEDRLRCDVVENHATSRFGAAVSDIPVADNKWHHVACTYDGSQVKVFVDGVQRGSTSYRGVVGVTHEPLVIGKDPFLFENRHLKGIIDEVAIFSRPLTAPELGPLMSLTAERCAR
jgi:hypothetical protein